MERFTKILVGLDVTPDGQAVSQGSRRAASQAQWLAERSGAALTFLHASWADAHEEHGHLLPGLGVEGERALERFADEYRRPGTQVELEIVEERPWIELSRRAARGAADLVFVGRRNQAGDHPFGSTAKKLIRKCPVPVWVVKPDAEILQRVVLAATDLSAVGDRAIELGAYVARTQEAALHVVHAWQLPMSLQLSHGRERDEDFEEALESIGREASKRIHATLARIAAGLEPHVHAACDSPSRLIREAVIRLGVDLLVMGTLSRSGVPGLLMGNTAERILAKVDCSVLAIKPEGFVSPVT